MHARLRHFVECVRIEYCHEKTRSRASNLDAISVIAREKGSHAPLSFDRFRAFRCCTPPRTIVARKSASLETLDRRSLSYYHYQFDTLHICVILTWPKRQRRLEVSSCLTRLTSEKARDTSADARLRA